MRKIIQNHGNKFEFCGKHSGNSLDDCKQGHAVISFTLLKDKSGISSYTYYVES